MLGLLEFGLAAIEIPGHSRHSNIARAIGASRRFIISLFSHKAGSDSISIADGVGGFVMGRDFMLIDTFQVVFKKCAPAWFPSCF